MRKTITLAAAAAMLGAVAICGTAQAMTVGAPAGVHDAAATIDPVDRVACWRYGWHGWGWYPCAYYITPYIGPGWGWRRGWGGWHGGWHGWRH